MKKPPLGNNQGFTIRGWALKCSYNHGCCMETEISSFKTAGQCSITVRTNISKQQWTIVVKLPSVNQPLCNARVTKVQIARSAPANEANDTFTFIIVSLVISEPADSIKVIDLTFQIKSVYRHSVFLQGCTEESVATYAAPFSFLQTESLIKNRKKVWEIINVLQ